MTPQEEAQFEVKAEKHFRGHPELRNGRNFHCWNHIHVPGEDDNYRRNYDAIFPNSLGAGM